MRATTTGPGLARWTTHRALVIYTRGIELKKRHLAALLVFLLLKDC
jgi:hypothetical protein